MPINSKLKTKVAMVLAAGLGKRMQGVIDFPKSMIQLGNHSLMEHILNSLHAEGINKFVVNTHYKAEILEEHITNLPIYKKAEILFSREENLLETAGGIKNALDLLDSEVFFALNTDVFWQEKTKSAIQILNEGWNPKIMDAFLLLINKERAKGYSGNGDFDLVESNLLNIFQVSRAYVYIGIQIIKSSFFDKVGLTKIGLGELWQQRSLPNGDVTKLYGNVFDGEWLHIGDPEAKKFAEQYFLSKNY